MNTVSIVIPVFNSEKYLEACLNSILQQRFVRWESILIDDGSTDASFDICNEYARLDNRFKVFHKSNGGVSSARNMGLSKCSGDWVTFVDSDDIVAPDFLEKFHIRTQTDFFDVYISSVAQVSLDGREFIESQHPNLVTTLKCAIMKYNLLELGDLHAKIFRTKVIKDKHIRFDQRVHYSEDRLFLDNYLNHCTNVAFSNDIGYRYLRNENGLSFKINSFESEVICFRELIHVLSEISDKTQIELEKLLHDVPAERVWRALYMELNYAKAKSFCHNISSTESQFLDRVLKKFKLGSLLHLVFIHRCYMGLYVLLKIYSKL